MATEAVSERRLTSFSHGAGCGCKLGPDDLLTVLRDVKLPPVSEDVLVAADTGDDAAVYRLPSGEGLIATLDFFTPIVDDPYDWGRIAATNALSDVYAMGGRPLLALNIVNWPVDDLPLEMLARVLQGGVDVAAAEGVVVAGGHSITDPEPKYGMVAVGLVPPDEVVRNSTAPAGAALYLTKPLGLGIVSTAIKRGLADDDLVHAAIGLMTTTNRLASEAMRNADAEAATDVTGFGLLGHGLEMARASGEVRLVFEAARLPALAGTLELARAGIETGGAAHNRRFVAGSLVVAEHVAPELVALAHDPQTSGGLLAAVAGDQVGAIEAALNARGVDHWWIGRVEAGEGAVALV